MVSIKELINQLKPTFSKAMDSLDVPESTWLPLLGKATVEDHGDVALPCHSLAGILKKAPQEIAEQISELIASDLQSFAIVSSMSGFVNITAKPEWLSKRISILLRDTRLGVSVDQKKTFAVDYSAPNVAKEMHVGHLRSTVIGDTIVRMLEFKGHTVIRENHVGDWGTPFGMLIEHLLDLGEDRAADELGVGDLDSFYKQARSKFVSDEEFANRSRRRVVLLQGGDAETLRLWRILVDESMRYFNEVYSMLGVMLTDDDNYSTSDLACIIDRVERLGCDGFLYVVGTPQKQHFEMVFQVAMKAGFMSHNHQAVHVNFGSVLDTDGKVLKSREGEVIKLHDLLKEAIRRAERSIDDKNPDLAGKEREEVARAVGIGAVKYADLSTERTKDYVFDWEKMLSFEGNTAPYLQYAYARISSIFRKWGGDRESLTTNFESLMESDISTLRSEEILLSRRLVEFPSILDDSVSTFSPHKLCKHLHSIASSFASFYENCGILKEDNEKISHRRLALCEVTSRELKLGLEMMGINVPERM